MSTAVGYLDVLPHHIFLLRMSGVIREKLRWLAERIDIAHSGIGMRKRLMLKQSHHYDGRAGLDNCCKERKGEGRREGGRGGRERGGEIEREGRTEEGRGML